MKRTPLASRAAARRGTLRRHQHGMVLMVALIVLALISISSLAVLKAADTGNVIAGNYSFQQAATQSSDRAITDALNTLSTVAVGLSGNSNVANRYFATKQTSQDARGMPSTINWNTVSCVDPSGVNVSNCAVDTGDYRIQYVIERMCASNPDMASVNDIRAKCEYEAGVATASASATAASIGVRYRVLIRVRGPRGTEGWYEAMVSGPAST